MTTGNKEQGSPLGQNNQSDQPIAEHFEPQNELYQNNLRQVGGAFSLDGKTALITGAASGIGYRTACTLASAGATIIALDRSASGLDALVVELMQNNHVIHTIACDVSDHSSVKTAIDKIWPDFPIDILVNSAGIAHIGSLTQTDEADLDRLYEVNIKGIYNTTFHLVPRMADRHFGVIVNLASVAAHVGIKDRFAYSMTKSAVHSMSLSIARDYIASGIRCNCISPGRVHTAFVDGYLDQHFSDRRAETFAKLAASQPMGRMAQPSEIAALIHYLVSDEAAFISGCDFPIDGGLIHLNTP